MSVNDDNYLALRKHLEEKQRIERANARRNKDNYDNAVNKSIRESSEARAQELADKAWEERKSRLASEEDARKREDARVDAAIARREAKEKEKADRADAIADANARRATIAHEKGVIGGAVYKIAHPKLTEKRVEGLSNKEIGELYPENDDEMEM